MPAAMLFDTNIVADFFNGVEGSVELFANLKPHTGAISVVTYTEALVGFENERQQRDFDLLTDRLLYFSVEKSTARIAAELKKQYRFKLPDAYQAALAIEHKLILVTRNTKNFDPAVHKFVKIPYRLKK